MAAWVFCTCLAAQPSTGIVATPRGEIFFADPGAGVWKLDTSGKLSLAVPIAPHSLALDVDGAFANTRLDPLERITPNGAEPSLIGGDESPVTIGGDGHVYYANAAPNGHLEIVRLRPGGEMFVVADIVENPKGKRLRTVNGIASGPGKNIYLSSNQTVRRVSPRGEVSLIAGPLSTSECPEVRGVNKAWRPYLTGLTVDSAGTIYVAATGCAAVLKIAPDGKVSTLHRTPAPWTPAGVAISRGGLYMLEYDTSAKNPKDWLPRVEKLTTVSVSVAAVVTR